MVLEILVVLETLVRLAVLEILESLVVLEILVRLDILADLGSLVRLVDPALLELRKIAPLPGLAQR